LPQLSSGSLGHRKENMHLLIDGSNFVFHKGKDKPGLDALESLFEYLIRNQIPFSCFFLATPPLFPTKTESRSPTEVHKRMKGIESKYSEWLHRVPPQIGNKDDDSLLLLARSNPSYHILSNDNFSAEGKKMIFSI
jgi:hypothetical protein